ncbi:MAG: hypothetical protein AVDCRST_MAG90-912 [uncultured Microvirga sp.]|uniref:Uncharacterized protein n=1 Tax=uncultured Microvirga sp. TaxID=412392 RepID=A0A6J4KYH0_9HYPH|nr:MAG: hypothetical protein AVDCRST_MAG90-912 [uncultured Microvirga sp.]
MLADRAADVQFLVEKRLKRANAGRHWPCVVRSWVSGAAHAALLGAVIVGFAWEAFPEIQEGIAVEVISDSQFAEMTRGERQADTVQPDLKPRVDRVAETVEERDPGEALVPAPSAPTRPPEMQVAAREVAPPPPPPPMPPRREVANQQQGPLAADDIGGQADGARVVSGHSAYHFTK